MDMIPFLEEMERLLQVRFPVKILSICRGSGTAYFLLAANIFLKKGILKPVYEQNKCVCLRI